MVKKKALKKTVKKPIKKTAKKTVKKIVKKSTVSFKKPGVEVGRVTHYFPHVQAAVIKVKVPISVGDKIKILGHTTDFTQSVVSMQLDHVPLSKTSKGQEIGLEVASRVRRHDKVYKL